MFIWLKFFKTALDPSNASTDDLRRFGRMAKAITAFGILFLIGAAISAVFWLTELRAYGSAPQNTIAVQDFEMTDLQGRLNEAQISGTLQLSDMTLTQTASGMRSVLIPLTQSDWTTGDPVSVLVQTHLFIYDQQLQTSGERYEMGLAHLELPEGTTGPTEVSMNVIAPRHPAALPATSEPDVSLVEYVRPKWRATTVTREVGGLRQLVVLLGLMGLGFAGLGRFAVKNINDALASR